MRVFDTSGAIIETGGGRRAAAIGVLRVDHPDILEFIEAKREQGVLTQFNISVGITNKFLEAVKTDGTVDLTFGGKVYNTVKAVDIWKKLISSAYNFNDPGLLMLDEVNKYNNGYYMYDIATTNPLTNLAAC
jgi:ribonucleoside-diphosphate reductase alpha chain